LSTKEYKITYQEEGTKKYLTILSDNIDEEDLPQNILKIEEVSKVDWKNMTFFESVKKDEFLNLLMQLEIILRANILLNEAIDLLIPSTKNKLLVKILESMKQALSSGQPIYEHLKVHEKHLDYLVIPFFTILEKKGNIKLVIASLVDLLQIKKDNHKLFISAIRYPLVVLVTFMFSLILIFNFVVPKFEAIFLQYKMELPFSTQVLLSIKTVLFEYHVFFLIILFLFGLVARVTYKRFSSFHLWWDKVLLLYLPYISKMIVTYELYNFFLALNILLKSRYEFHIAVENASILLKNKYLLDRITKINEHLKNGQSVQFAFSQTKIFNELTISLINTGEKSSSLPLTISELEKIYKEEFQKSIKNLSSFIEPIFFIGISLLVLWIMLAVFTPIWNMSGMLNV
jgi:general secretion pathway protein F